MAEEQPVPGQKNLKKSVGHPPRNIDRFRNEIADLKQDHGYTLDEIREHIKEKYGNEFSHNVIGRALLRWGVRDAPVKHPNKNKNGGTKQNLEPWREKLLEWNEDGFSMDEILSKFSETFDGIRHRRNSSLSLSPLG
jgi:hypothetical protein